MRMRCAKLRGFTLVELLVVIAIIAVVAGLVIGAAAVSAGAKERKRTQAEMNELILALDDYKGDHGTYPPSNPSHARPMFNPLFYELTGVTYEEDPSNPRSFTANRYRSKVVPAHTLTVQQVNNAFGIRGFVNRNAKSYLNLDPEQFHQLGANDVILLQVPAAAINPSGTNRYNFWNYTFRNPNGRNPTGYELWAEIKGKKAGETITIASWDKN